MKKAKEIDKISDTGKSRLQESTEKTDQIYQIVNKNLKLAFHFI